MTDTPGAGTPQGAANEQADRLTLDTILDLLAADKPEGLNWPGVARLVRRVINPPTPSVPVSKLRELIAEWEQHGWRSPRGLLALCDAAERAQEKP